MKMERLNLDKNEGMIWFIVQMNPNRKQKNTKKQHYVPQFYLRQWIDATGGFYPMEVKTKTPPLFNIFKNNSNPSRFCFENFFYAQQTGIEDDFSQILETKFAEIEAKHSLQLPQLEKKILNNEQITDKDKYALAEMMIFFHFRGKKYLDQSKKMTDYISKETIKLIAHDIITKPEMKELELTAEQIIKHTEEGRYTTSYGNDLHLSILNDMDGFSNLLFNKYWKVYLSRKGEFITTDAPYLDISLSKHFLGNDFLSREQFFILSPRIVIVATYPDSKIGKKFVRKDITENIAMIRSINMRSIMNSIRFGFHSEREILEQLESTIKYLYFN